MSLKTQRVILLTIIVALLGIIFYPNSPRSGTKNTEKPIAKPLQELKIDSSTTGDGMVEIDSTRTIEYARRKIRKAIWEGDMQAYKDGSPFYILEYPTEFIFYTFIISQRYQYAAAYMDSYIILRPAVDKNALKDVKLLNFTYYNLARAYELGYKLFPDQLTLLQDNNGKVQSSNYFLDQMKIK